ncbi:DUF4232 domain-containing protein [Streptomyces sp. NPDC101166]|uniref:DUF4232 domain-containing protein n=1 Tax=Streptomyces sp. NPDC101166 TaxID=3366120 RepID=UPI0037F4A994
MRRPAPLLVPALAAVLLLSACGSERAGDRNSGPRAAAQPSLIQVSEPAVDGVRIVALAIPSDSPSPTESASHSPSPSPSPSEPSDFRVTPDRLDRPAEPRDLGVHAVYEVTNESSEALTYTIAFAFTNSTGEVMDTRRETVSAVAPGKTVRSQVELGDLAPGASPVTRVKIAGVTKVPAAEAPGGTGDCPASGTRLWADEGDAAMGLRVVGLHVEYCGKGEYTVEGYPLLELLDDDREPVDGVKILKGSKEITTGLGDDEAPRPVTLKSGETAIARLVWRNTTGFGTPVNVPYVRVRAKAGAAPVTVTPRLDLGTTGKLGVTPWQRPG